MLQKCKNSYLGKVVRDHARIMFLDSLLTPFGYRVTKRPKPGKAASIFVVTVPKSGSMFLARTLTKTLDLEQIEISPGYFPIDHADVKAMVRFSKGGFFAQSHLSACEINLNILSHFCDKWVVHFRDPRAAVLSWTHHKERPEVRDNLKVNLRTVPLEPTAYSSMSFSEKIDWQIDNHLPNVVHWMERWCKAIDSTTYKNRIVVSNYENIVGRDEIFVREILTSLGREMPSSIQLAKKDMKSHFRRGDPDEWTTAFTPAQIEKASSRIPHHLMERFGWKAL
jgi:hypothetical protein